MKTLALTLLTVLTLASCVSVQDATNYTCRVERCVDMPHLAQDSCDAQYQTIFANYREARLYEKQNSWRRDTVTQRVTCMPSVCNRP